MLPIHSGEYDQYSGELDGLLDGGVGNAKILYWCSVGKNPAKTNQSVTQVILKSKWKKVEIRQS